MTPPNSCFRRNDNKKLDYRVSGYCSAIFTMRSLSRSGAKNPDILAVRPCLFSHCGRSCALALQISDFTMRDLFGALDKKRRKGTPGFSSGGMSRMRHGLQGFSDSRAGTFPSKPHRPVGRHRGKTMTMLLNSRASCQRHGFRDESWFFSTFVRSCARFRCSREISAIRCCPSFSQQWCRYPDT